MKPVRIIDTLQGIASSGIGSCLVLYSGGVDGTYFLDWASNQGMDIVAFNIGLEGAAEHRQSAQTAQALGVKYVFQDLTEEFLADYVSLGIKGNAYYQTNYPVCSSLSRPLMAKAAVALAHQLGIEAIVHTSTYMQNSAARFTMSIMALDPSISIVAPFLRSQDTREEKLKRLQERGLTFQNTLYSVDKNIWGRVIESGAVLNPEDDLPSSGIFTWTSDIEETPDQAEILEIEYHEGLPRSINGQRLTLLEIVEELNRVGGKHGIGRFSGLEDITFGAKNHEVREAPAAQILITAHRELEAAILSNAELSLKLFLDNYWTNLIVSGFWYSHIAESLSSFINHANKIISGKVKLKLHKGNLIVLSRQAENGLYYAGFQEMFSDTMQDFSFLPAYAVMGFSQLQRAHVFPRPALKD